MFFPVLSWCYFLICIFFSILNKLSKRDSELKRENMWKCREFWKYIFPNCAAWCWQDDKGPRNRVQTQHSKITQLACAVYVCYMPTAEQVLLNKWQIWYDALRIRPSECKGFQDSDVDTRFLSFSTHQPLPSPRPHHNTPFASTSLSAAPHACTRHQETITPSLVLSM